MYTTNRVRMSGLYSGIDTDALIKQLMTSESAKLNKMTGTKTRTEWKKAAYTDFNNVLRKFREEQLSVLSSKANMLSKASYNVMNLKYANEKQPYFTVSAGTSAKAGTHTIDYIKQLAAGAKSQGESGVSGSEDGFSDLTKTLDEVFGNKVSAYNEFEINGVNFSFTSDSTLQQVMDRVNSSKAGVTMSYSQLTDSFSIESTTAGAKSGLVIKTIEGNLFSDDTAVDKKGVLGFKGGGIGVTSGRADEKSLANEGNSELGLDRVIAGLNSRERVQTGAGGLIEFTIATNNGTETFSFDANKATLNDIMKEVNESSLGVKFSYNAEADAFTLMSDGTATSIDITGQTGNLFGDGTTEGVLGINLGTYAADDNVIQTVTGKDAILSIDGVEVTRSSNKFSIDGLNFNLQRVFNATADPAAVESFSVTQDLDKAVENIREFVSAINTVVTSLYTSYYEKAVRGFDPLTDEEKDALTEKEVEKWETEAKKGLMRRDPYMGNLMNEIRSMFSSDMGGYGFMSEIGITTSAYKIGEPFQIEIDETKLQKALSDNPEKVMNMFTATSSSTDTATKKAESGFAVRISDAMLKFTTDVNSIAQKQIDESISSYEKRIKREQERLIQIEERYWKKYSALESALSQMQGQSDYVTQLFSSMSSN
ncbi:flagellar filament capping protein FliD [Oscillospiraceae bacterium OttesenSCG-928-G22]|nr:flagellar filament capping protein FliD [Oscillospiraceae bacterium OttesenSCG-928-G22]